MLLYFHKDPLGNFGDDLNPWLWPKIFPGLFSGEAYHDPKLRGKLNGDLPLFVGIGTLLNGHVPSENRKVVFGAGAGYGELPRIDERWEFAFVRGPLTAKALGLPLSKAVIDPAILAADHAEPHGGEHRTIAYMPHCASARNADWAEICGELGLRYIDPHWRVDRVLLELQQTSELLTEALHGAVLAEAFRIPWAAIQSSPGVLTFKWEDWCQSIGRPYEPECIRPLWRAGGTALGRMRFLFQKALAGRELRRISRNRRTRLSKEDVFNTARARLLEKVSSFRASPGRLS